MCVCGVGIALSVPSYLILTKPDICFLVFLLFSLCDPFGNSGLESQELPRVNQEGILKEGNLGQS